MPVGLTVTTTDLSAICEISVASAGLSAHSVGHSATSVGPSTSSASSTSLSCAQGSPLTGYRFPKKNVRSCHSSWFEKWKWLLYVSDKDHVLCFVCTSAIDRKLLCPTGKCESAFIKTGFNKWAKGPSKFTVHETSEFHQTAAGKIRDSASKTSIESLISQQTTEGQEVHRNGLRKIFSAAKFLGSQGFPFRGETHEDGAFRNLVLEMSADLGDVYHSF